MIPQDIPDLGSARLAPRQNPLFTPGTGFTTEDYFVWSRLDGHTTLHDLILMVGLGTERSIEILRSLRRLGAVLLPGEEPHRPQPPAPAPPPPGAFTDEEQRAMTEPVQLQEAEKRRIIEVMRMVRAGDYFAVLGVSREVDRRELKRAYFRMSKEFHPDRHYKQELGTFGPWLSRIFETATTAFQVLDDDVRRAQHASALDGTPAPGKRAGSESGTSGTQNRSEHAAELVERGCDAKMAGDLAGAVKLLAAAARVDPQPRYLRRAAACALAGGQLSEAEEYAKKAASLRSDDASYARVLADVHRAAGRLNEAEEVLLRALKLPSASDLLARELEADLAAVRAARGEA